MKLKLNRKKPSERPKMGRRGRRKLIAAIAVGALVWVLLIVQAILGLMLGDYGWENAWGLRVDPIVQLLVAVVMASCGLIWLWRRLRGRDNTEAENDKPHKGGDYKWPHQQF